MIVKFTKNTEVLDRAYMAGQSHEFDEKTAAKLIRDGVAIDPKELTAEEKPPKQAKAKK